MTRADQKAGVGSVAGQNDQQRWLRRIWPRCNRPLIGVILLLLLFVHSGCSGEVATPTRTPVPTWTPTPEGAVVANPPAADQAANQPAATPPPQEAAPAAPTETPTPEPPTPTPLPTDTPPPAETPTPAPTDTPAEPTPTPTSEFQFTLEAAEKFPTDSLAPNVVRIYLYVHSPTELGLGGYSLRVIHNGTPLTVEEVSIAGLPEPTRLEPGPYTRFMNLNLIFVEPQAGRWDLQLIDEQGNPVGPAAPFELTADERTRELYVRYVRK